MTRRSRVAALVAGVLVLTMASGLVYLRGGSTPVGVGPAVERFRRDTAGSAGPSAQPSSVTSRGHQEASTGEASRGIQTPAPSAAAADGARPRPKEGVYVYATTGGDEVDVLGGSRHTYPEETTITVRHDGCGLIERWDALEERWDERESCRTPEGDAMKRTTSFHEFFGRADERTLHCEGFTAPAHVRPGDTWTSRCASADTTATSVLRAVGWEDVDVGGVAVRSLHVHVQTRVTGEQDGRSTRDVWGSAETGLVVRERAELTSYSMQPVFGRTRYHESYEIRLVSLEPRR